MAAAAAAADAAALGLGEKDKEEDVGSVENTGDPADDPAGWEEDLSPDDEDPPLDEEAIDGLKAEFLNSLVLVFDYTELAAQALQDKLCVNEPVDLLQAWGNDIALESACNNLIPTAHHNAINGEVPAFRYSMSQGLILYRNWVNLRMSRGLTVEATDFKRKERTFMYNAARLDGHQGVCQACFEVGVQGDQVQHEGLVELV
jgi:hypothetical protein